MCKLHHIDPWLERALGNLFLFELLLEPLYLQFLPPSIELDILDNASLLELLGDDFANLVDLWLIREVLPLCVLFAGAGGSAVMLASLGALHLHGVPQPVQDRAVLQCLHRAVLLGLAGRRTVHSRALLH